MVGGSHGRSAIALSANENGRLKVLHDVGGATDCKGGRARRRRSATAGTAVVTRVGDSGKEPGSRVAGPRANRKTGALVRAESWGGAANAMPDLWGHGGGGRTWPRRILMVKAARPCGESGWSRPFCGAPRRPARRRCSVARAAAGSFEGTGVQDSRRSGGLRSASGLSVIQMIDDGTSRCVARVVEHDTTERTPAPLGRMVAGYGSSSGALH